MALAPFLQSTVTLYLASENVMKKWTQRYRNWDQMLNQLIVLYGERSTKYLQKEKAGTSHFTKNVPAIPYSIGISSIARNTQSYSRAHGKFSAVNV